MIWAISVVRHDVNLRGLLRVPAITIVAGALIYLGFLHQGEAIAWPFRLVGASIAYIVILFATGALSWVQVSGLINIFDLKWTQPNVRTVLIYSLARPELNLPSGFDFVDRRLVEIQQPGATGAWDLLVDTRNGQMVFITPGAVGIDSEVMVLAIPDMAFEDVILAPEDSTLYTRDQPIPIETSSVYVLRTHKGPSRFGVPCVFWGKLQPTQVEPVLGTVEFIYDVSILCDDRGLVPED